MRFLGKVKFFDEVFCVFYIFFKFGFLEELFFNGFEGVVNCLDGILGFVCGYKGFFVGDDFYFGLVEVNFFEFFREVVDVEVDDVFLFKEIFVFINEVFYVLYYVFFCEVVEY